MLRGRSKALGVEGHLRQVGIQGYGRLPYGYPVDTLWDTMWIPCGVPYGVPYGIPYGVHCGDLGTLGGTLRTPGSSRETQERLKRDSRETQERLKTVSRQSQDSLHNSQSMDPKEREE